jgi:sugar transferase (PEP-CTERM/EpsH1 system associated)
MRILFLTQRVPFPPNRGDKITTFHELRHLAGKHEVTVACLADGEEDMANLSALSSLTAAIDAVPLRPIQARLRALSSLGTEIPLTVAYFGESRLHQRVAATVRQRHFEAIIVYSSGMAQFVEPYSDVPRIMQFADLDSLKWQQYAQNSRFPRSWVFHRESRLLLEYERKLARAFSHSLVCTPRELDDLERLVPGVAASCIGNGVDLERFRPQSVEKLPGELVFTGVMDYYPNVEGIVWFCRDVLPLIRREVPRTTLTICGARPNARVRALARIPGVSVTGLVTDVRPYLAKATVAVVPVRITRGIQNKLLEAMAAGLPAVACSAAARGVEAIPGTDLFVADDPGDFAHATVRLLSDADLRRRTGEAARTCMEANYRWEHQLERLDRVLEQVTECAAPQDCPFSLRP